MRGKCSEGCREGLMFPFLSRKKGNTSSCIPWDWGCIDLLCSSTDTVGPPFARRFPGAEDTRLPGREQHKEWVSGGRCGRRQAPPTPPASFGVRQWRRLGRKIIQVRKHTERHETLS